MQNLARILEVASTEDRRVAQKSWLTYSLLTGDIAEKFGFSRRVGAAVFAALSPTNDYLGNLRDTRRLLEAVRNGISITDCRVSTYHSNRRKAWIIAQGADPLSQLIAPKTRSFFLNIADPSDPIPVTVDGHIFNAWRGLRVPLNRSHLSRSVYEKIAEDVRQLGQIHGIVPNQVQALIWHTWRRINRILWTGQLEFWDAEVRAAGTDFIPIGG